MSTLCAIDERGALLEEATRSLGAISSSWHQREGTELTLIAAYGLPASLIPEIEKIPCGKGMAGQAWCRRVPISTCDLQNDRHAPVEAGARQLPLRDAFAIPLFQTDGAIAAVIGFAFQDADASQERRLNTCIKAAERLLILSTLS